MKPPEPENPFLVDHVLGCWLLNVTNVELTVDAEGVDAAYRAFPGRLVTVDEGGMTIHMSDCRSEILSGNTVQ